VTFIDLCGHEKYLKTTLFGMMGLLPDYVMILVGANMGLSTMTKEHIGIALSLKIPIYVVITKIDIAPKEIYQ
jgi:GTPase